MDENRISRQYDLEERTFQFAKKYKHEGMIIHKEAIELKKIFSSILVKSG